MNEQSKGSRGETESEKKRKSESSSGCRRKEVKCVLGEQLDTGCVIVMISAWNKKSVDRYENKIVHVFDKVSILWMDMAYSFSDLLNILFTAIFNQ